MYLLLKELKAEKKTLKKSIVYRDLKNIYFTKQTLQKLRLLESRLFLDKITKMFYKHKKFQAGRYLQT